MTEPELRARFERAGVAAPMARIAHGTTEGVAIRLGENLTRQWQSGDIIAFWSDGEHTVLPDDFTLVELMFEGGT